MTSRPPHSSTRRPDKGTSDIAIPAKQKSGRKSLISLLLVIHLVCVFLAMAANMSPSLIQLRVLRMVSPYTIAFNWQLGGVPFELTHGTELEGPWVVEIHESGQAPSDWRTLTPSQVSVSQSHLSQLNRVAGSLAAQADDDRVSGMLSGIAKSVSAKQTANIDGIRLTRLAAPEYRQFGQMQMVGKGEAMVAVDFSQPEVAFEARVLKLSSGEFALVKQQSAERSSLVVGSSDSSNQLNPSPGANSGVSPPRQQPPSMLNQLLESESTNPSAAQGQQP